MAITYAGTATGFSSDVWYLAPGTNGTPFHRHLSNATATLTSLTASDYVFVVAKGYNESQAGLNSFSAPILTVDGFDVPLTLTSGVYWAKWNGTISGASATATLGLTQNGFRANTEGDPGQAVPDCVMGITLVAYSGAAQTTPTFAISAFTSTAAQVAYTTTSTTDSALLTIGYATENKTYTVTSTTPTQTTATQATTTTEGVQLAMLSSHTGATGGAGKTGPWGYSTSGTGIISVVEIVQAPSGGGGGGGGTPTSLYVGAAGWYRITLEYFSEEVAPDQGCYVEVQANGVAIDGLYQYIDPDYAASYNLSISRIVWLDLGTALSLLVTPNAGTGGHLHGAVKLLVERKS